MSSPDHSTTGEGDDVLLDGEVQLEPEELSRQNNSPPSTGDRSSEMSDDLETESSRADESFPLNEEPETDSIPDESASPSKKPKQNLDDEENLSLDCEAGPSNPTFPHSTEGQSTEPEPEELSRQNDSPPPSTGDRSSGMSADLETESSDDDKSFPINEEPETDSIPDESASPFKKPKQNLDDEENLSLDCEAGPSIPTFPHSTEGQSTEPEPEELSRQNDSPPPSTRDRSSSGMSDDLETKSSDDDDDDESFPINEEPETDSIPDESASPSKKPKQNLDDEENLSLDFEASPSNHTFPHSTEEQSTEPEPEELSRQNDSPPSTRDRSSSGMSDFEMESLDDDDDDLSEAGPSNPAFLYSTEGQSTLSQSPPNWIDDIVMDFLAREYDIFPPPEDGLDAPNVLNAPEVSGASSGDSVAQRTRGARPASSSSNSEDEYGRTG